MIYDCYSPKKRWKQCNIKPSKLDYIQQLNNRRYELRHFGGSRWWWNYALDMCIETYKTTGKGLTQIALNKLLPNLKKQETQWLSECYSQVLQSTTLNLVTAYKNFFESRAKYPLIQIKKK